MIKARDIITKDVITVHPDTEIIQAAKLMLDNHLKYNIRTLPVCDQGGLVGVIGKEDIVRTLMPTEKV